MRSDATQYRFIIDPESANAIVNGQMKSEIVARPAVDFCVNLPTALVNSATQKHNGERLVDLIELIGVVLAVDRLAARHVNRDGGWERILAVQLPVRDLEFWRAAETTVHLTRLLGSLTWDKWHFTWLDRSQLRKGSNNTAPSELLDYLAPKGRRLLFSGGIDSLAAACGILQGNASEEVSRERVLSMLSRFVHEWRSFPIHERFSSQIPLLNNIEPGTWQQKLVLQFFAGEAEPQPRV